MIRLILTAAAFALIAAPAHAGPMMAAVAWIGNTIAAGGIAGAMLQMAIGVGAKILSVVAGKAMAERPAIDVQFDVQFGDDTPLSFIAGDYVTAGKRKYIGSWGKNTRYITEVIEVSCLPQPGIAGMWVDDEEGEILWGVTEDDDTGYTLGHPLTAFADEDLPGKHFIWIRWLDGTQTAADPMLVALFGSDPDYPWTSAMIGRGKTYAVVTTRYNADTLTSYPAYLFQPQPLPMYDPRKDSTAGGSGAHRWGNRATYEATRNPALIAYNIARGIYYGDEWIFGGKNLPAWRLPRAEWIAAANACDRAIALAAGGTEPAYRCGLQITVDMRAADVLEEIGRAANMRFAEVGGMLKPVVDLPGAAVLAFNDGDVNHSAPQVHDPFQSLGDTYNAITATYPEPGEKWASKDAPEFIHAGATAEDGGRYLPISVAYGAVPYRRQVQRLMRAQMQDFRRFRTHQIEMPPEAYGLEPLDLVSWTSARNGYIAKLFIVESVEKTPGMNVRLSLREVDPSDYDWDSDYEFPTTIVTPRPVRPWVQVIDGFSAEAVNVPDSAGRTRGVPIRAWCNGDEVGISRIRFQVRKSGDTDPSVDVYRPWGAPYSWLISAVTQRTTYQIRARLYSRLTPKGQWTGWLTVTTGAIYVGDDDFIGGVTGLFESAGMKPTRDIADRSVPGNYDGELAWSRADNALYSWDATAGVWVHFIAESLQGVLDETWFAANIRVPKIVTGALPTTGNRVGDLVYRTNDGLLYRWTGALWTAEVSATQIVGQLIAGQIAAGAIGAEQLAAKAVVASKMAITDFANLVSDDQIQDLASWGADAVGEWVTHAPNYGLTSAGAACRGAFLVTPRSGGSQTSIHGAWASCQPGEEIFASARVAATGAHSSRIIVQFADFDGASLATFFSATKTTAVWERLTVTNAVAPAGATQVRLIFRVDAGGYTAGGHIAFSAPVMRRKGTGELIVDGTIRGIHIVAQTITGGLLATTGIITGSAQITNGVIQRAHIEDLAVNSAKIADLSVGTLKIGNRAVTQQWAASFANITQQNNNRGLNFTLSGDSNLIVGFTATFSGGVAGNNVSVSLSLNGSTLGGGPAQSTPRMMSGTFAATGQSGANTLLLSWGQTASAPIDLSSLDLHLFVFEAKK